MSGITSILMLTLLFCLCPNCHCAGAEQISSLLSCPITSDKEAEVYLLDSVTYKFLSMTDICIGSYPCIGAVKDIPDNESKFKMILRNGKVALQASNGRYLSRVAYSNDATNSFNYIQAAKTTIDHWCQFTFEYTVGSPFENVGKIAMKADNDRYLAPHEGTTVKPLATVPHEYILLVAERKAETAKFFGHYRF